VGGEVEDCGEFGAEERGTRGGDCGGVRKGGWVVVYGGEQENAVRRGSFD
jgi:hypothetical protein